MIAPIIKIKAKIIKNLFFSNSSDLFFQGRYKDINKSKKFQIYQIKNYFIIMVE